MIIFCLSFVVIYKIGLKHAEIVMVLSTYVTHNGPWTGRSYYNLTTTNLEGSPYPLPGDASICSVCLSPVNIHITKPNKAKTKKDLKKLKRDTTIKPVVNVLCFLLSD